MAKGKGLRTADGLGMLLHQAVLGFERWFGVKPEVTAELRALVEEDLLTGAPKPVVPEVKAKPPQKKPKTPRWNN
jgi:shikimate dehydrogenase